MVTFSIFGADPVGKLGNSSYEHPIEFSGHAMQSRDVLTHKDLISFAYQVARGMEYLESKKVTNLVCPCWAPCETLSAFIAFRR